MSFLIDREELQAGVHYSLRQLWIEDDFLLRNKAHERSITHKLAEYLQKWYPDYEVDCEYSLNQLDRKMMPRECIGRKEEYVYPDIVMHLRGVNSTNLMVIEAKLNYRGLIDSCDEMKLLEFTRKGGAFEYDFGLFVGISGADSAHLIWFSESNETDRYFLSNAEILNPEYLSNAIKK